VDHVLEVSCSDRFTHCGFDACNRNQPEETAVSEPTIQDLQDRARNEFARQSRERSEHRKQIISEARVREKQESREWQRVGISNELEEISKRRLIAKGNPLAEKPATVAPAAHAAPPAAVTPPVAAGNAIPNHPPTSTSPASRGRPGRNPIDLTNPNPKGRPLDIPIPNAF
jgi:hypothetical protein